MDWLAALAALPPQRRAVAHQPETARYARARQQLPYVVQHSVLLGAMRDPQRLASAVLIATWAPPPTGRGSGYYCCFRLFMCAGAVDAAVLFCFYDGTERSPKFRSAQSARSFALANGFHEELP